MVNWKSRCKGCGDCCGIVHIAKSVWKKNKDKIQKEPEKIVDLGNEVVPITDDLYCPFLDRENTLCMIYSERPSVCRKYGETDELPCPYYKKDGSKRPEEEREKIKEKISNDVDNLKKKIGDKK